MQAEDSHSPTSLNANRPSPSLRRGGERGAVEMAGPRGKCKAKASPTGGDLPDQPKPRRGAAAPPLGPEVFPGSSPCVYTMETTGFSLAHTLRSGRRVWVPSTANRGPMQFKKGKKLVYDISWHTPSCAKVALEHYNRLNEDKHELVKAVDSISFFYNGQWMHANFLAKSKGGTSCADLVPKYFFAELKMAPDGKKKMSCVSCIRMDQGNPETAPVRGCGICPSRIFHPAAGGHIGASTQGARRQDASLPNVDAVANA